MKLLPIATAVLMALSIPGALHAASVCPAYGAATAGCDLIITVSNSGITVAAGPSFMLSGGTYDGSDDTLVGIVNNTSSPLSSINLSSTTDIFGFDGDGIDDYGAPGNTSDGSGYGGPDTYFTGVNGAETAGTVDFLVPIAAGGSTYFSLEEALVPTQVVVTTSATPEPGSFVLLATGLAGCAGTIRRRLFKK